MITVLGSLKEPVPVRNTCRKGQVLSQSLNIPCGLTFGTLMKSFLLVGCFDGNLRSQGSVAQVVNLQVKM